MPPDLPKTDFPASDTIAGPLTATQRHGAWPDLPYAAWRDTCVTLHLWTQIVGKVRLAGAPWLNHSWHVPLYVSARGLTTSPIPDGARSFEIEFDFIDHQLTLFTGEGRRARIALRPQPVADFFAAVMAALAKLGIQTEINDLPCEIPGAIRFRQDRTHDAPQLPPDGAEWGRTVG